MWNPFSTLDRATLRDLQWWVDFHYSSPTNGVPLWSSPPTRAIWTDENFQLGYGSILQVPQAVRKTFGVWWSLPEKLQWHITMKELVSVRGDILRFADDLRGHTVCLYEDNQAVVVIMKNRTSSSSLLMGELRPLMSVLEQLDIQEAWCLGISAARSIRPTPFQGRPTATSGPCHPPFNACSCSERKLCFAKVFRSMPSLVHSQK